MENREIVCKYVSSAFETVEAIEIEKDGGAVIVRFVRPALRNPLSVKVLDRLYEIVNSIENASAVTGLIFTGCGGIFASGADLREISAVTGQTAAEFARHGQELMYRIDALRQTTVAAINGPCFGGALDLALACKYRISVPDAKFAHPGAGLGIITGWGGTQRLPRLVGRTNALEMFFTAAPVPAQRALEIGLIDEIAEDALSRALEFVRTA